MRKYKALVIASCLVFVLGMGGCLGDNDGGDNETLNQSPSCSLSVNPTSGNVPLNVTFSITASDTDGNIVSWTLDINNNGSIEYSGSGTSNTQQHNYTSTGTYTAKLTVTDNDGKTNEDTQTVSVTEAGNQPPSCSLSANPTSGTAPLSVTFSMSASDTDGSISSWALDINNDGSDDYSGTGNPPSTRAHTYQNKGTYTAEFTVTDDDGSSNSNTVTVTVSQQQPQTVTLQGSGDDTTQSFELQEGVTIFEMSHTGSSNFAIWLYNVATAEQEELLVNEIGNYDGSVLIGVTSGYSADVEEGTYLLEVTADGNWQVTIEQPRPSTADDIPTSYSGNGDTVPQPFTLDSGLVEFEMSHTGSSNFAIWLYHADGEREELLVNEIGSYTGSTLVSVSDSWSGEASPGIHYISVTADGNWQINISQG